MDLERAVPFLKVAIVVLVIALLAVTFGLVGSQTGAPRSELERAVFAAEEAVKANPQDAQARVKLAAAYLEEGSTGRAVQQAQFAVRLAPKSAAAYYVLGLAQEASGSTKDAIANLTKATKTTGEIADFYSDAYTALARVQEKDGDIKTALRTMGQAIDNAPENALLLYARGQMYERGQQWVSALDDYSEALSFVPDYPEARDAYSRLVREHPDALKKLKALYSTQPKPKRPGKPKASK